MRERRTALTVLVGCIAFVTVAWTSLSVEGEATGTMTPGLHLTTETAIPSMLWQDPVDVTPSVTEEAPSKTKAQTIEEPVAPAVKPTAAQSVPTGYVYWKTVRAKVTAYDPSRQSCGKYADGKTSIGQNAWVMDGVAADPTAVPYGSYVAIPGAGVKEVDDTGKAMRDSWRRRKTYHFDVRMSYPYQAKTWGVKYLDVKLYKKAS